MEDKRQPEEKPQSSPPPPRPPHPPHVATGFGGDENDPNRPGQVPPKRKTVRINLPRRPLAGPGK